MKHLKLNVNNNIPVNIQADLVDIGYELTDNGFSVRYQWCGTNINNRWDKYPHIIINKWEEIGDHRGYATINNSEISDYIDRIREYLDSKGYNIIISNPLKYIYTIDIISRDIYGNVFEMKLEDSCIPKNIQIDLEDICLELEDEGFKVRFYLDHIEDGIRSIYISIYKWHGGKYIYFTYPQISECVNRIEDYLDSKGYSIAVDNVISFKNSIYKTKIYIKENTINEMKHLKKFNESNDIENIEDICLELKDLGLFIKIIDPNGYPPYSSIYIETPMPRTSDSRLFYWNDLEDCVLRLRDYLNDRYIGIYYSYYRYRNKESNDWVISSWHPFDDSKEDSTLRFMPISEIQIRFK